MRPHNRLISAKESEGNETNCSDYTSETSEIEEDGGFPQSSIIRTESLTKNGKILIFGSDFESYHLRFIQAGIQHYFESGDHTLSYVSLGIHSIMIHFGKSVGNRLVVIGLFRTREAIDYLMNRNIPFLNLINIESNSPLRFDVQFKGEGTLAANYFINEMNMENFAFVGKHSIDHCRRLKEFEDQIVAKLRKKVNVYEIPPSPRMSVFYDVDYESIRKEKTLLRRFLMELKKPVGIFCGDDGIGFELCYTAEVLGIKVPEEISILGIGSRDEGKEAWARAVSVVQVDHHLLGQTAARLMDEYIQTGIPPRSVRLKPSGIRHSQTTFGRAVEDPLVRNALKRIQKEPSLTVVQLCDELKTTRAILDARFLKAANMTVTKSIELERFIQAKRLIRGRNNYSLEAISSLAGYPSPKVMRLSFYRFTRMNPRQFRELNEDDA